MTKLMRVSLKAFVFQGEQRDPRALDVRPEEAC